MTSAGAEQVAGSMARTFRQLTEQQERFSCPDAVGLSSAFIRGAGPDEHGTAEAKGAAAAAAVEALRSDEGAGTVIVDGSTATAQEVSGLEEAVLTLTKTGDQWLVSDVR